jgi:hypothetical protein
MKPGVSDADADQHAQCEDRLPRLRARSRNVDETAEVPRHHAVDRRPDHEKGRSYVGVHRPDPRTEHGPNKSSQRLAGQSDAVELYRRHVRLPF